MAIEHHKTFSKEALAIIDLVANSDLNLFVTGKAGTGKSTLLHHLREMDQSIIVLAPTGIAAINVQGETIHSFFKLKPGYELDEAKHVRIDNHKISQYAAIHTIFIDEISMVRADVLDAIDIFLQRIRSTNKPFGGIRMIFFGDLYQLPPVLLKYERLHFSQKYSTPYFFSSHVFIQKDLFSAPFSMRTVELTKIYRQKDIEFIDILNALRENQLTDSQLQILNQQAKSSNEDAEGQLEISIVSTNSLADRINQQELNKLNGIEKKFLAHQTGMVANLSPNDAEVKLKKGAQVIFLNNDPLKRWMNGTIGKVLSIETKIDQESDEVVDYVQVALENGTVAEVVPYTWEISKYNFKRGRFVREAIGTFTQIPVKLAWAITIHKSQGKTFNKVKIDLGKGSFAHGQTYVALSRCKSLASICLSQPISKTDIIVDESITKFMMSQTE